MCAESLEMKRKVLLCSFLLLFSIVNSKPSLVDKLNQQRLLKYQQENKQYDELFRNYQDYYSQHPNIQLTTKRTGIRGISSIINDPYRLIMCTIPKIGSSTWRKFMLYLNYPDLTTESGKADYQQRFGVVSPDAHNISKNGVKLMALQSPQVAVEYYNNKQYLKVFHTRNPITRVLSAWLSKNAASKDPLAFAKYSPTFEIFIQNLTDMKIDLNKADGHIRYQHTYCDFDRGAHYDIFLKFESRSYWGTLLLNYLSLQNNSLFEGFIQDSQIPFKGADTIEVILKHYNMKTFQQVKDLYHQDIISFNYQEDVQILEKIIRVGPDGDKFR